MKLVRFLLLGAAVLAGLLLLVVGIAATSSFQTWAARKAIASRPDVAVTLDRVSVGLNRVQLQQVRAEYAGAVLTLPAAEVELPLIDAAWHDRVTVSRLVLKGWTFDLTQYTPPAETSAGGASSPRQAASSTAGASAPANAAPAASTKPSTPVASATSPAASAAQAFQGIFDQLKLPLDLALDGIELDGEVIFPDAPGQPPGRATISLRGGQLATNREGQFTFTVLVSLPRADAPVNVLSIRGSFNAAMDSPRTFTRLVARIDAEARGPSLPQGVQLTLDAAAARVTGGENYTLNVQSVGKRLVDLQANYPAGASRLGGIWKLDVRDTDVAPFALGRPLPSFEAVGAGMFETDTTFTEIHAAGRLKSSADGLAIYVPELATVGALALFGEFDLTQRGGTTRIDKLVLNVNRPDPVLAVQSLQAFEFNPGTGELKVADPAADLLAISLQGLPTRWVAPFLPDYALTGGLVRGEFTASAGGGGLVIRSKSPLQIPGLSLAQAGQPLVTNLDVAVTLRADYSPQGWQAELSELRVSSAGAHLLTLSAKAGQLAGQDQVIKAAGQWTASLPALLQQPVAKGSAVLARGQLTGDFAGSLGSQREVQARFKFTELAVPTGEALPEISAELRADVATDGKITFQLPLIFANQSKKRQSDLAVSGSLVSADSGFTTDARLVSQEVFVEDVLVLAALAGESVPTSGTPPLPGDKPFWNGISGQVVLALKKLHYNDQFEVSDVNGTLHIDAGALKLDGLRAALGEGGAAKVTGGLTFAARSSKPYALAADLAVSDFNPAPFFRAINPGQPATVEGKFTVTSKLTGQAATLAALADDAQGDFQLTSKGGVFRGLPVSIANKVETTSRIAAGVAAVGSLFGSGAGKDKVADIANKAQAVSELGKTLTAIPYDQLSVVLSRDATLAAVLKDFTLIAPEVRLSGAGTTTPKAGAALLDSALAMEFKLSARGHTADLLKYLDSLEAKPDELGYTASTLPLRVSGTLGSPSTSELNQYLANLALEKSGASDLLPKWLGGGK